MTWISCLTDDITSKQMEGDKLILSDDIVGHTKKHIEGVDKNGMAEKP